jgi:3-dehydroquinate synthase
MRKIRVNLKDRSYDIIVGIDELNGLGRILSSMRTGKDAVVVTNEYLEHLHGARIRKVLRDAGFFTRFERIPDTERSKSIRMCSNLIGRIATFDRLKRILLVALGGGVVGDLTGFVAAIYKRGRPYIQIPTTLLGQVDSAIGGKVAVDLPEGKNLVGSFYQPRLVFSDISFLKTLSTRQIQNGLSEVVKYGVITDISLFEFVQRNIEGILRLDTQILSRIVYACSKIKARVVERDEFDNKGQRVILNYGHTIGHALESACGYGRKYYHGEAVSIGMVCAAEISEELGLLRHEDTERLENVLIRIGLPVRIRGCQVSSIMSAQEHDKKFIAGRNRFVLPAGIGKVVVREDVPLDLIERVIKRRLTR